MATNDSVRTNPRSAILDGLGKVKTAREPEPETQAEQVDSDATERSDPLPRPGLPYKAHARRTAKPQMTLFFVQKDYMPDGYSYANMERVWLVDSKKEGSGPVLMVRFYGSIITEVMIEGRNLYSLCNAIGMHLMPWAWEYPLPKDFGDENEPFIRKISFNHSQS